MAQFLQEPGKSNAGRLVFGSVEMCELSARFPAIWEYLTEVAWESGAARLTSTLMVFSEDGMVKLCFHDRSCARTAWVSHRSLTGALASLDEQLASGHLEWRRDRVEKKRT